MLPVTNELEKGSLRQSVSRMLVL